jgi:hypothetical protein
MLWARQDTTRHDVELTDETRPVTVVMVGDFLVKGWAEFATFGRASTGGWATDDALFCLADDYDLDSEKFRISYLKHETRHRADYDRFPALEQIDLEYRAKLTELAYADTSLFSVLETFLHNAQPNPAAPHAYAADALVRDLSGVLFDAKRPDDPERWRKVAPARIHRAARELLARNTAALEAAGASTVTGVIYSSAPSGS